MTPQTKAVQQMGWEMESFQPNADVSQFPDYRAVQGSFCTPWRSTQDQVVEDVKAIKAKREEKQE